MSNKIRSRARVNMALEIKLKDKWTYGHSIDDIHGDASKEAESIIRNALAQHDFKILGEPEVTAILVKKIER